MGDSWGLETPLWFAPHGEEAKDRAAVLRCTLLVPAGPGLWLAHGPFLLLTRHDSSHATVVIQKILPKIAPHAETLKKIAKKLSRARFELELSLS